MKYNSLKLINTIDMKKIIKGLAIFILIVGILLLSFFIYFIIITSGQNLDKNKLMAAENTIRFYDINGDEFSKITYNRATIANLSELPEYVKNSFISVEDKRFYKHKGIDYKSLMRAGINNLKSFSFKEGASTISQQLIKNTHLTAEKTIKRKLVEYKLTKQLEKAFSKDEIIEKYLNTIYFGENSFGIENASQKYFNKSAIKLTIEESATLAGIIKAPTAYSPYKNYGKCKERRNLVLKLMLKEKYISENEYTLAINTEINLSENIATNIYSAYTSEAEKELGEILSISPYAIKNCRVYTYLDKRLQENLFNNANAFSLENDKSAVIIDNKNHAFSAYYSTTGNIKRQLGSVIKPLISYAPAIENNIISEITPILDEKTNFNGYSPSNYNDKYLGYISATKALETSSNVVAVKLLNYVGIDKAKGFLSKMNINLSENDNGLCLALGALYNGVTLNDLANAYSTFACCGNFYKCGYINKVVDEKDKVLYQHKVNRTEVFDNETTTINNYMLESVVKNGTARKLSGIVDDLCGKTGTVGTDKGNTDAYSLSYSNDFTVGVWLGNKDNSLMENSITGGGYPSSIARKTWEYIKDNKTITKLNKSEKVIRALFDKISYENDHTLILADNISPVKYTVSGLIKESYASKLLSSTRFVSPSIEKPILSVNTNTISIRLCVIEYYNYLIYRENNGKKKLVYDTKQEKNKLEFLDTNLENNMTYSYYIIPYYDSGSYIYKGEEMFIDKVKINSFNSGDWWLD